MCELGSGEGGSKLHNAWQGPVLTSLQQAAVWVAGSKAGVQGEAGVLSCSCAHGVPAAVALSPSAGAAFVAG